jgi:hypothetical protein
MRVGQAKQPGPFPPSDTDSDYRQIKVFGLTTGKSAQPIKYWKFENQKIFAASSILIFLVNLQRNYFLFMRSNKIVKFNSAIKDT